MILNELLEKVSKHPESKQVAFDAYLEDFIPNQLLKSPSLKIAFGITEGEMNELYKQGYEEYQKKRYTSAKEAFRWLIILDTFEEKYWLCYAATQKMLGDYEKALYSYAMVTLLDDKNPDPHFHAFECYRMMKNETEAKKAFEKYQSVKKGQSQ